MVPSSSALPMCGTIYDPGRGPYLPGWCWPFETEPSSTQLVGWGFHTLRCGIDPGDNRFHPQSVWSLMFMEGFMIQGWAHIRPECCWLHGSSRSPISWWGWGLQPLRGDIYECDYRFRPQLVGIADVWKDYDPGRDYYLPRVVLALSKPSNRKSVSGVGYLNLTVWYRLGG